MSGPRDSDKVVVRRTRKWGRGVFAKNFISRGELIAVFDGPLIDDQFEPWTEDLFNHAIQVGPKLWRDSLGIARWVNHSCDPNCGIKKTNRIVAMRDIQVGEQITWDYEMTEKNKYWKMKCRCGSPICRKSIGHYKNMPDKIRKKYKGFISDWISKKPIRSKSKSSV